jgi:hypothetical protein
VVDVRVGLGLRRMDGKAGAVILSPVVSGNVVPHDVAFEPVPFLVRVGAEHDARGGVVVGEVALHKAVFAAAVQVDAASVPAFVIPRDVPGQVAVADVELDGPDPGIAVVMGVAAGDADVLASAGDHDAGDLEAGDIHPVDLDVRTGVDQYANAPLAGVAAGTGDAQVLDAQALGTGHVDASPRSSKLAGPIRAARSVSPGQDQGRAGFSNQATPTIVRRCKS